MTVFLGAWSTFTFLAIAMLVYLIKLKTVDKLTTMVPMVILLFVICIGWVKIFLNL